MSRNGAIAALAREGGLPSTLWAGPEAGTKPGRRTEGTVRSKPVHLRLGFGGDEFGYAVDLGLPPPGAPQSLFNRDPSIKRETIWSGPVLRPATALVERTGLAVAVRERGGTWSQRPYPIASYDSMLSEFADPEAAPEVYRVRDRIRSWRFYDHFRTDADAPARDSHMGTRTPVLSHDGGDVAAALQTVIEIGDAEALATAIDDAFPGSRLAVRDPAGDGRLSLELSQPGLLRPLAAAELSDGTLRYLLLVAALLTPRPPELLVLNEPETSLHPDLLAPLGALIAEAAAHSQVIVVSHSQLLIAAISRAAAGHRRDVSVIELIKNGGETRVVGQEGLLDTPLWHWPKR